MNRIVDTPLAQRGRAPLPHGPKGSLFLGVMALLANGFETWVYSRSKKPNPKAELVESLGAQYISSLTESVDRIVALKGRIEFVPLRYRTHLKTRITRQVEKLRKSVAEVRSRAVTV